MRFAPLAAGLLLLLAPLAGADAASGVALAGPSRIAATGETTVPLDVTLRLANVLCTRDARVPVTLSIVGASGARASLADQTLVFRLPASAGARGWSAAEPTALTLEATAAVGLVEVLAAYRLPAECVALRGGSASGDARHTVRIEAIAPPAEPTPGAAVRESAVEPRDAPLPTSVHVAILLTAAAGVLVLAKRLRATRSRFEA